MDKRDRARSFSYMTHLNDEPTRHEKLPAYTHPFDVAEILERHGCSEEEVAAGYLHDTTENTKTKISEIYKLFGREVAYLVFTASERSTSEKKKKGTKEDWVPRKEPQVFRAHYSPIKNKHVIAADKLHNIHRLIEEFTEKGKEDWSLYNQGREGQLWFFTSIYNSLIYGENPEDSLFVELRMAIEQLIGLCEMTSEEKGKVLRKLKHE